MLVNLLYLPLITNNYTRNAMLIRATIDNLFSFKEATELNMLPNKSKQLEHHKTTHEGINILRFAALYGANGAGKSNFIKAISLLVKSVKRGTVIDPSDIKFKLSKGNLKRPSSIAIEFFAKKNYYYSLTFDTDGIFYESLSLSFKERDETIFERSFENGEEQLSFSAAYEKSEKNKLFIEVLRTKLLSRKSLLLSFLGQNYAGDFPDAANAYIWMTQTINIISTEDKNHPMANMLDNHANLLSFSNELIRSIDLGISDIQVQKNEVPEDDEILSLINANSGTTSDNMIFFKKNAVTGDSIEYIRENGKIMAKKLTTLHKDDTDNTVIFPLGLESDGSKRLVDFLPMIYDLIKSEKVYLIDEIESSIHPMAIKALVSKLSASKDTGSQLLFTTHESCLLDQEILRTDEIWFCQKDQFGSSRLYPLSDYNVHHTANIENGYLNGRYGAIPFLSNLKDLHWSNE